MAGPPGGGDEVVFGGHRLSMWPVEVTRYPTQLPPAISVVNENVLTMRLTGSSCGELWVRYLRVGHGPGTTWLDLIAAGLPGGLAYTATVGDCVKGQAGQDRSSRGALHVDRLGMARSLTGGATRDDQQDSRAQERARRAGKTTMPLTCH